MPRLYPPDPTFGEGRYGERAVWEALRDQLPDEAALIYSLNMIDDADESEADLVVLWPDAGVVVIEVKGGRVGNHDMQWFSEHKGVVTPMRDPVEQAQRARHNLQRLLKQRGCSAATGRFAHMVAFPFTHVPADWSTADCSRAMVIAEGDMHEAAARVLRAIDKHGAGHRSVEAAEIDEALERLEMSLPTQTAALHRSELEARIDQMTRDQGKLIRNLSLFHEAKVIGGPGTGKTWLAMEQARRLSRAGQRVALVCYSRGLGRFLQRTVQTWPQREQPAYVGLFHELPIDWGAERGADDDSDYWERRLPARLQELAAEKPAEELYDAIVVDEAQDFGQNWWPATTACLRDPKKGLFVFLDEAQRVFDRAGEPPIALPPFTLDENIRNTKQIAQVFGSLADVQARYVGVDGPPVRFHACTTSDAVEAADDAVDAMIDAGWDPGHIALLTTYSRHPLQKEVVDRHGHDAYWDEFFAETDVFYGHVLGFKGLERPAVILAVNGFRDAKRAKEMLYVGLSRARLQLVVCGDLDRIAQVGGEGVRRRLAHVAD